jgi:hypothetical protein
MNRGPRRQVFVAGVGVALGIGKPIPFEAGRTFRTCAFDSRPLRQVLGVLGRLVALPGRKPGALWSIEGSNPSTPTKPRTHAAVA